MTLMLASVRSLAEAQVALDGGADLIDLKEPSRGALGALDHAAVRICVQAIGGRRPLSATIGDPPSMEPREMSTAVERMAATGVNYVKIGFFAHSRAFNCALALTRPSRNTRLIAVLFADEPYSLALVDTLADAGFAGAMLDTARKTGKTLRDWRSAGELDEFVGYARGRGLLAGLAGSLRQEDVSPLLACAPDYLGFRGALCRNGARGQTLDEDAFAVIRGSIPQSAIKHQRAAA